jgi:hypothetical protein
VNAAAYPRSEKEFRRERIPLVPAPVKGLPHGGGTKAAAGTFLVRKAPRQKAIPLFKAQQLGERLIRGGGKGRTRRGAARRRQQPRWTQLRCYRPGTGTPIIGIKPVVVAEFCGHP